MSAAPVAQPHDAPGAATRREDVAVRRAEETVAVVVAFTALAAGAVLVGGLIADTLGLSQGAVLLRVGCAGLLAVPLVRNAAVIVLDKRRSMRGLAAGVALLLVTIYAVALSQEAP